MAIGRFGVIFFDLGETLVTRVPGAVRAAWVPGAQVALAQLAARGVRLGLISNTTGLSRAQVLDRLPTDFQFNQFESGLVILSSETAPPVEKPDPEIFRRAVQAAHAPAGACLFCGESLIETLAAQKAGLRAARLIPPPNSDLSELVATLDQLSAL